MGLKRGFDAHRFRFGRSLDACLLRALRASEVDEQQLDPRLAARRLAHEVDLDQTVAARRAVVQGVALSLAVDETVLPLHPASWPIIF